jgi:hypothetical protein
MSNTFDAALPPPYSGSWKQAERPGAEDSPRLTSYQAPGGEAIGFIQKSFTFSGGQSMDTAEYPFNGLWSNEALNEKPQTLRIEGFIRGSEYIKTRNALIEALRIKTDDTAPGFIDFPFWGRFPVVVIGYEIAEHTDEKGQCAVNLECKRAGVTIAERENALSATQARAAVETAVANLETAAVNSFEEQIAETTSAGVNGVSGTAAVNSFEEQTAETISAGTNGVSGIAVPDTVTSQTLAQAFGQIKSGLLTALGRVQAPQTLLNNITGEINGLSSLLSQGIRAPGELARSLFNAMASIAGGLAELKNSVESYLPSAGSGSTVSAKSPYPAPEYNNEKNALLQFLSASEYALDMVAFTVRQEAAKKASENLYRISALSAAGQIMIQTDYPYQKTAGYWRLLRKLEDSIDKEDPAVYAAVEETRVALSRWLSARELGAEKKTVRYWPAPAVVSGAVFRLR